MFHSLIYIKTSILKTLQVNQQPQQQQQQFQQGQQQVKSIYLKLLLLIIFR